MPEQANLTEAALPTLTRAHVADRITDRLTRTFSDAQLSKWAFDQFYKIELETLQLEEPYAELLAEIIDELMFADEPGFQLADADLQALVARLRI